MMKVTIQLKNEEWEREATIIDNNVQPDSTATEIASVLKDAMLGLTFSEGVLNQVFNIEM